MESGARHGITVQASAMKMNSHSEGYCYDFNVYSSSAYCLQKALHQMPVQTRLVGYEHDIILMDQEYSVRPISSYCFEACSWD